MVKKLRKFVFIKEHLLKVADQTELKDMLLFALSIPVSFIAIATGVTTAIHYFFDSIPLGVAGGIIAALFIATNDRGSLEKNDWRPLVFRIPLTMVLAIILTFPAKVYLDKNGLTKQYYNSIRVNNQILQDTRDQLILELDAEEQDIMKAREAAGAEYAARIAAGKNAHSQSIADTRRTHEQFIKTKESRLERINKSYELKVKELSSPTQNDLYDIYFQNLTSKTSSKIQFIFFCLVFMFFESLPIIFWIKLKVTGAYLKETKRLKGLALKAKVKRDQIQERLTNAPSSQELEILSKELILHDAVLEIARDDFRDIERFNKIMRSINSLRK